MQSQPGRRNTQASQALKMVKDGVPLLDSPELPGPSCNHPQDDGTGPREE